MADTPVRFGSVAATLAANGYRPVPIKPGAKYPGFADWQHFAFTPASERAYPDHGAGILLGDVVGLYIDVDDADAAAAVETAAREVLRVGDAAEIPRRIGRAPRVLLPLRCARPFHKLKTAPFKLRSNRSTAHVELLAAGQQFVAYGVHPDTHRPYLWNGGGDLLTVKREELLEISEAQAREIVREAEAILEEWGDRIADEPPRDPGGANTEGPRYGQGGRNEALTREAGKLRPRRSRSCNPA